MLKKLRLSQKKNRFLIKKRVFFKPVRVSVGLELYL